MREARDPQSRRSWRSRLTRTEPLSSSSHKHAGEHSDELAIEGAARALPAALRGPKLVLHPSTISGSARTANVIDAVSGIMSRRPQARAPSARHHASAPRPGVPVHGVPLLLRLVFVRLGDRVSIRMTKEHEPVPASLRTRMPVSDEARSRSTSAPSLRIRRFVREECGGDIDRCEGPTPPDMRDRLGPTNTRRD